MNDDFFSFTIGDFTCMAISDGTMFYGPPLLPPPSILLFANAPASELQTLLHKYNIDVTQWSEWPSSYVCLLIDTGEMRVLVDTGANGIAPTTGKLPANLEKAGIKPGEIDLVILSHAHPDHIGGNTLEDGRLAYPNADFVMSKREWEFWTSGEAEATFDEHTRDLMMGFANKNLPPLQDKLRLIEGDEEIVPGITAINAPGHTPGHIGLLVSSNGEQLMAIVDTVLHPIHLQKPGWTSAFDIDPPQVVATRQRVLNQAADKKALVLAFHFPFPGLGLIVHKGDVWEWQPITTA